MARFTGKGPRPHPETWLPSGEEVRQAMQRATRLAESLDHERLKWKGPLDVARAAADKRPVRDLFAEGECPRCSRLVRLVRGVGEVVSQGTAVTEHCRKS